MGYGYKICRKKINHLEILNSYGQNDYKLDGLLKILKAFSDNIGIIFGLGKCAKSTFIRGKLKYTSCIKLDADTKIRKLDSGKTYKYRGIEQGDGKKKEKKRK